MSQTIKDFRLVVEEARKAFEAAGILLRHKEETLARMENQCQHRWSEAKYTPEHHESYTIPAMSLGLWEWISVAQCMFLRLKHRNGPGPVWNVVKSK
jgi:hypothetical protein